ncbi:MAG: helix-turn-helix transcriptional regulator [Stenotrophomonas maltophilia]|uniref:helix-turn-helix domain-containing protein n=1 Tax=Stenotrophomonas sp. GD04024 TaxID=2975422 RepID=UPI0013109370|nr:AraC family transcriptional regulator [Stenotrophomonas sp. GD04024]MBS4799965.1 helix-turn-helix transcriptional regulator [Stenotrophomonas maltophilia]MDG9989026.1 AraC family transcriptional regulator [Stenotrophomonas sp. GD04024]
MAFWTVVFAIGAAQAALLALALWRRPANAGANRVLAMWIALIGIDLAVKALYWDPSYPAPSKALRFVGLFPFLYGSLFYVYVRVLTEARAVRWRDAVHLSGFIIVLALHAGFFLRGLVPAEGMLARTLPGIAELEWMRLNIVLYAYSLSYVIAGLLRVGRYRRGLLRRRSDADRMSLHWIDAMAISQILIWLIATTQWLVRIPWIDYPLIYGLVAAWVFLMGYFSLTQPAVLVEPVAEPAPANREVVPASDDARVAEVEVRLSQLMAGQQLYREPALTIGQLARRSGYPEYLVSAVINRRFGGNFWEYINRQRIEAAASHLADGADTRTILDIAYACGFTSKSTFNAAFKRLLGETPSAFRKRHAMAGTPQSPSR